MQMWTIFWAIVLLVSLGLFAGLAVVIGVGAFFDLRELLRGPSDRTGD